MRISIKLSKEEAQTLLTPLDLPGKGYSCRLTDSGMWVERSKDDSFMLHSSCDSVTDVLSVSRQIQEKLALLRGAA